MKRRFFTLASLLSLMLCTVTMVFWACSLKWEMFVGHTVMPREGVNWHWRTWMLWSQNGGARFSSESYLVNDRHFVDDWVQKPGRWERRVQTLGTSGPQMPFPQNLRPDWGFGPMSPGWGGPMAIHAYNVSVFLPYWCVVVLTIPLPAIWLIQKRRHTRFLNRSLCRSCGYNLTGNTSGVCPECGGAIKQKIEVGV